VKFIYSFLLVFAFAKAATAQSYVDLVKINYGTVINAGYEGSDAETNVRLFDVSLTYPIQLNEQTAIVTGLDYSNQSLDLFPNALEETTLSSFTLKAGVSIKHSDRWSGTYLLLPKIASQELKTGSDAFFIGGVVLMKYQKTERLQYRFGAYASSEGFGTILTPIIGLYYQSENKHWEATMNFPINGDVNYTVNDVSRLGFNFQSPIRSYVLDADGAAASYVQTDIIEVGPYLEHSVAKQSILLRFQVGYSSMSYSVYEAGDQLPFRLAAFEFADDRNRLNPETNGNFFLRLGATYRFHLVKETTQ
jgi:hypothetical protein